MTDCLCYTPKIRQGDKHQSSTHPRPLTRHFPFSSFIFQHPRRTSATLLPAFQLLYPQQVTSSGGGGGGEMVYKCTSCGGFIYCMMRSNGHSYELKVGSCSPLLEADRNCYIYSERLTAEGGRPGDEGKIEGEGRHLINTKPHEDTAREKKKRRRRGMGSLVISLSLCQISHRQPLRKANHSEGRGGEAGSPQKKKQKNLLPNAQITSPKQHKK